MKRFIWALIIVLLTLVGLALLYQFREAILLFFLSLAITAVFRPMVEWFKNKGLPRTVAILLTYILGIGTIGVLVYFGIAALLRDSQALADQFSLSYTYYRETWLSGTGFLKAVADQLPPIEVLYQVITGTQGQDLARGILGVASGLVGVLSKLAITIVLSIYWSIDESRFERLWLSILPASSRVRAREIWQDIQVGLGAYIRSELLQSILMALLLSIIFSWMQLPYPAILGVTGALFWLIPWLGALLAMVLPVIVGFAIDPLTGAAAGLVTLLVLGLMEFVVEPRIFNRNRFSSLLIVLFMLALANVFGLIGVLIAPPIAAAVQIFFGNILSRPTTVVPADPLIQLTQLRSQLLRLREGRSDTDETVHHIDSWTNRLDGLIKKSEETVISENRPAVTPGSAPRVVR
jgi:predicted PurR-regulated permease PerM